MKKEWLVNNYETEDQFQVATMIMISQQFPQFRDKVWHTKNEVYIERRENESQQDYDKRSMIVAGKFKSMGLLAGVMDIFILYNGILYKIELKLPKGKLSDKQKNLIKIWDIDCPQIPVIVARTLFEVYEYCKWIIFNNYKICFE